MTIFATTYALTFNYLCSIKDKDSNLPYSALTLTQYEDYLRHTACYLVASLVSDYLWPQRWIPKQRVSPQAKAVFITGCDTGFGNLLARKLDAASYKVFAACLLPDAENARKLKSETTSKLEIIKLDVTRQADVDQALARVAGLMGDDFGKLQLSSSQSIKSFA